MVRLTSTPSGSLNVPSLQTPDLQTDGLNLSNLTNGYLQTNSGIVSSVSNIPVENINSNSLSNGYLQTNSGSVNSSNKIPISDISLGNLSNGVLLNTNGVVNTILLDASNLSNTLQTRLNTIETNITNLQNGGNVETLSLDDTVLQMEATTTKNIPNFGKNWYQLNNTIINGVGVACSGNGQYIIMHNWSSGYNSIKSSDFGNTWESLGLYNGTLSNASISMTGQYMCIDAGNAYISSDYGKTWNYSSGTNSPYNTTSSSISSTGKYVLCSASSGAYLSSDYGTNWVKNASLNTVGCAISHDGTVGYVISSSLFLIKCSSFANTKKSGVSVHRSTFSIFR
jgi:hypothetical protein